MNRSLNQDLSLPAAINRNEADPGDRDDLLRSVRSGRRRSGPETVIAEPGLFAAALALPLLVGIVASLMTMDAQKQYFFMNKPPLSPPAVAFPVVWTILYVLMGISSYLVITSDAAAGIKIRALAFYAAQLFFNFMWSILFFAESMFFAAFVWLLAMLGLVIAAAVSSGQASRSAGLLYLPYIAWTVFAAYLNFAVYRLSITPMPLPR